ncbi:MAG: YdcF family protein, partial [Chloroflexi bacterium]|nr:YdcF family protein [Chloroflexota bacterium]
MPRSVALFEKQGFEVIPAPTDFSVTYAGWERLTRGSLESTLLSLLPSGENLAWNYLNLKEYLGIFIYKLNGWL